MKKTRFIMKRIVQILPMLLVVSALAFTLSNLSAGNAAEIVIMNQGGQVTPESVAAVKQELGLDKPLYIQYFAWLGKVCTLDFGVSFRSKLPVLDEIKQRFPATLSLILCATLFSILLAVPTAILSARYKNKWIDHLFRVISTAGASIPDFWLGLILLYAFAVQFKLVPVIAGNKLQNIFLPAFTLSLGYAAIYTRMLRTNLIEIMKLNYMKAARAKGLSESAVLIKHGLKNAVIPCLVLVGNNIGSLIAGSFACEVIFSWNGIGKFAIESIKIKDFPVIQGYVLAVAFTFIVINLIMDICYAYIDPKIKLD